MKHGVSSAQAATVLLDPLALTVLAAGHEQDGKLRAVSHTYHASSPGK